LFLDLSKSLFRKAWGVRLLFFKREELRSGPQEARVNNLIKINSAALSTYLHKLTHVFGGDYSAGFSRRVIDRPVLVDRPSFNLLRWFLDRIDL